MNLYQSQVRKSLVTYKYSYYQRLHCTMGHFIDIFNQCEACTSAWARSSSKILSTSGLGGFKPTTNKNTCSGCGVRLRGGWCHLVSVQFMLCEYHLVMCVHCTRHRHSTCCIYNYILHTALYIHWPQGAFSWSSTPWLPVRCHPRRRQGPGHSAPGACELSHCGLQHDTATLHGH